MRQKRAKAYRKLMAAYSLSFGFRQPYQVLADSLICKEAVEHKMDLVKQLGIVLQGNVKPMITQCCIHELYLQGKAVQPAVDLAKTFERRKCNHKEAIPGDECISSVIGESNKHRYVVATQSQPLRAKLRAIPAVPVVHFTRSVMILEPMSEISQQAKARAEQQVLLPSSTETAKLTATKPATEEPPKKKRKGPKGPNPLSMKKKKPKQPEPTPKPAAKNTEKPVNPGEKRKRVDDEEVPAAQPGATTNHGHKRKRRRKGASNGPGDDQASEAEH